MRIEINPISRIEGHAKVTLFFDVNGKLEQAFFQATELRGYEKKNTYRNSHRGSTKNRFNNMWYL